MIEIIPVGNTDTATLEALRQALEGVSSQRARIGDMIMLPHESQNQRRGHHLAGRLHTLNTTDTKSWLGGW